MAPLVSGGVCAVCPTILCERVVSIDLLSLKSVFTCKLLCSCVPGGIRKGLPVTLPAGGIRNFPLVPRTYVRLPSNNSALIT